MFHVSRPHRDPAGRPPPRRRWIWLGGGVLGLMALFPCAAIGSRNTAAASLRGAEAKGLPDYAHRANWLAHPTHPKRKIDVFYLYPTSYFKTSPSQPVISTIDDSAMVAGAKRSFGQQATAFSTVANIYAPYYRQADAVTVLTSPLATQAQIIGGVPAHDAIAAFSYYIQHDNHGRPFILAGHSQGSNVLLFILSRYLKDHPAVYRRMVAAYVIGYGVTRTYLTQNPQLRFANGADDAGVIVSWNTEARGWQSRTRWSTRGRSRSIRSRGPGLPGRHRPPRASVLSFRTQPARSSRWLTTPTPASICSAAPSSAAPAACRCTPPESRAASPRAFSTPTTIRSSISISATTRRCGFSDLCAPIRSTRPTRCRTAAARPARTSVPMTPRDARLVRERPRMPAGPRH